MKTVLIILAICALVYFILSAILIVWRFIDDFLLWDIPPIPEWILAIYGFVMGVSVLVIGVYVFFYALERIKL